MYARVTTMRGVSDIDGAVEYLMQAGVPAVQSQRGYKGLSAGADRSAGIIKILTLWETAEDREASDSVASKIRGEAQTNLQLGDVTVEHCEQRFSTVSRPPTPGNRLWITPFRMDPSRLDDNIAFFENEIVPTLTSGSGFRSVRCLVNPETGEGLVSSTWDDEDSMQEAAAAALARRPEYAESRGITFGDRIFGEIVAADVK